ncbi:MULTISPECIES: LytR/AlgR family response regulator transcription factor [Blautia]|uniref:LytR/AlgR family response regulator transcription factor n=1 Tax=Blautia TaxID=572511 RepID=UPI0013905A35|nr:MULTISPECIES: LytTR family DNA-binding domain-containing protein [Blautia]
MINIAICDDSLPVTTEIESLIKNFFIAFSSTSYSIEIFFDGETLWNSICNGSYYDIIFLDIEMSLDGITVARKMRTNDYDSLIIYISSYTSYLQELFEVEPFRFIQKPINPSIFNKYMSLAVNRTLSGKQSYSFKYKQALYSIPLKDILYFESRMHKIIIHAKNNIFFQHNKLNNIENNLADAYPPFLRIHQSFLVNLLHIQTVSFSEVILHDNTKLKISETRQKQIQKQYIQIMEIL